MTVPPMKGLLGSMAAAAPKDPHGRMLGCPDMSDKGPLSPFGKLPESYAASHLRQ